MRVALRLLCAGAVGWEANIDVQAAGARTWEDVLGALADELWRYSTERQADLTQLRAVAQARLLALDLRIVAGMHGTVEPDRIDALLESAHTLLSGMVERVATSRVIKVYDPDDEETLPGKANPFFVASLFDENQEEMEATLPGVPADVFRRYLATIRRSGGDA